MHMDILRQLESEHNLL